jgi:hypothetical protein
MDCLSRDDHVEFADGGIPRDYDASWLHRNCDIAMGLDGCFHQVVGFGKCLF